MISELRPLPIGAALQIALVPPAGALSWRVLRKGSGAFSGHDDPQALVAYDGSDRVFVDAAPGLVNEAPMFYAPFYFVGGSWVAGPVASGTPRATYSDGGADVQSLVRDRIEEVLKVEVARGTLRLSDGQEFVQVLTAPPMVDMVQPPLVTVHMEQEASSVRGVGELLSPDALSIGGNWTEGEGWLADVTLEIAGWSVNPEERTLLRKILRRAVIGNLAVFDAAGMVQINFQQRDVEFLNGEFGAPMFQTLGTFSCLAPVHVINEVPAVDEVEVSASTISIN